MIFLNAFIFPFISELLLCIYILTPPLVIIYAYTTLTLNYKLQMAILKISALQILAMFISIIMIIASLFVERGIFSQNTSYNYQQLHRNKRKQSRIRKLHLSKKLQKK